ncbi:ELMO3 [Cordylochernes scorpioides]|uniref:ELMO3 n=1 Tax=Cordylochernes scorpioides TaxID=51811 RepID=A0ABY6LAS9_9ARAC|nr:ELMO3 [Cordylochernes scorpioides]
MPSNKDSNTVKIAVEMENLMPQLIQLDQTRPLAGIIQDICTTWSLNTPEQYSLRFSDNSQNFITEKNRNEIKNGSILRLTFSASKTAQDILEKINNGNNEEKKSSLKALESYSSDHSFAIEFINKQGLSLLINMIESDTCSHDFMGYALGSFVELMEHGLVSWDILEPKFIGKIANQVNHQSTTNSSSLKSSLAILESLVLNGSEKYPLVEKEVTLPNLIMHLQSQLPDIQQNAIALINALFLKASGNKKKHISSTLSSRHIRNIILNNILQPQHFGAEMAHQLYVLQTLLLNVYEERMTTKLDPQDSEGRERILELRKIAFDTDNEPLNSAGRKTGGYTKDYKKLGFRNHVNPAEDFAVTPPGMLALDNMIYFAKNHTESYTKVVLENSCRADEHECPFGRTSIELTKLLCEILKVGELPTEQGKLFYPMFFTSDHPFEEFFCICILLLNKTWKEMRATIEDFGKVMSVVKEQITRASDPPPQTLEKFKARLATLTYNEITNLWQQERSSREEWESQARPIVELREQITPEILQLIRQQRLLYLCEGTLFTKYSTKGQRIKDKFWYCRLSPNYKLLHYGDCEEHVIPAIEDLAYKLQVLEIKYLVTGKECPHMKDVKRTKSTLSIAFSLILDSDQEPLNFVAPNEKVFDYWTDGINTLLGNKMTSKETMNDLETLLSMDIKLRLLDTEGVDIPENPPPIPDDPPSYDFCLPPAIHVVQAMIIMLLFFCLSLVHVVQAMIFMVGLDKSLESVSQPLLKLKKQFTCCWIEVMLKYSNRVDITQVITPKVFQEEGIKAMYDRVLRFFPEKCPKLLELLTTQRRSFLTQSFKLAVRSRDQEYVLPLDPVSRALWPEVELGLTGLQMSLLAPGNAEKFHLHYLESFSDFVARWNLSVYFQLRFQEIGGGFESCLSSSPLSRAEGLLSSLDVYPPFHNCVYITCPVVCLAPESQTARLHPASATAGRPEQPPHPGSPVLYPRCVTLHKVVSGLDSWVESSASLPQQLGESAAKQVAGQCATAFRQVADLPRLYRKTNREIYHQFFYHQALNLKLCGLQVPAKPSTYVETVLSPLEEFLHTCGSLVGPHWRDQWCQAVLADLTSQ